MNRPRLIGPNDERACLGQFAVRGRLLGSAGVLDDGLLVGAAGQIAWMGPAERAAGAGYADMLRTAYTPGGGAVIMPGLVDLHNHGGGGASFPDARTLDEVKHAAAEHLAHGTTTLVASLVSADPETLISRTELLASAADQGAVAGIHLEGPFLAEARRGAHDRAKLLPGDPGLVRRLAEAARGHLVTMTVAPEVPGIRGACGVIDSLAAAGAVPSFGHTDATAYQMDAAIDDARRALAGAGARSARPTATHLFNGMRPLHHREPGPVAACLSAAARGELVVELIADGVHLDGQLVRMMFDLLGPSSIVLVTDAISAAGMPDGDYHLGSMAVRVDAGVARTQQDAAIAGGTAHLLDVVRAAERAGVPLKDAVQAASGTPAHVLGRADIGALEVGLRADLFVTDVQLRPVAVMRSGRWHTESM